MSDEDGRHNALCDVNNWETASSPTTGRGEIISAIFTWYSRMPTLDV